MSSTQNQSKFSKLKRERINQSDKKIKIKFTKKRKKSSSSDKGESESMPSEYENDEENIEEEEDTKQENSLGILTKNFIDYIKNKGKNNININDLVKDLTVKKRRIYDITNVLQGIGYIEKIGKNEILWKQNYVKQNLAQNPKNINSLSDRYLSNYNSLKQENEELRKEKEEIDKKLNEYNDEFNIISNKKDFDKYGYVTFEDFENLSKDDKIDFVVIKADKGTNLNVIDDEESKKAFSKIKTQMECGKIQRNEKVLQSLDNLHHIFIKSQNIKLKFYKIEKGEIIETIEGAKNGAENITPLEVNNFSFNNGLNYINRFNNYCDPKLVANMRNNNNNNMVNNIKESQSQQQNVFNFDNPSNIFNFSSPLKYNDKNTPNNISNGNNSYKNSNDKQIFVFGNDCKSPSNDLINFSFNNNNNKIPKNNNNDINESTKKNNPNGLSLIFQQK